MGKHGDVDTVKFNFALFSIVTVTQLLYCSIVTWGVATTARNGLPTISEFLTENHAINIVLMMLIVFLIYSVMYLLFKFRHRPTTEEQKKAEKKERKRRRCCGHRATVTLLLCQITAVALIPVVRLDEVPLAHYVVASLSVVFSVLLHFILYSYRAETVYKKKKWVGYYNLLCIVFLIVLGSVFVGIQFGSYYGDRFRPSNITEFLTYLTVLQLKIFHLFDT
jgi:hypothetical protein